MRRRFQEVQTRAGVFELGVIVSSWGYPRQLDDTDYHKGAMWYRFGKDVIFWLQMLVDQSLVIHICAAPEARIGHGADARRLFHGIECIADLLRAERLLSSDCTGTGKVASYLLRLGFHVDDQRSEDGQIWYARELNVKAAQDSESRRSQPISDRRSEETPS